MTFDSDSFFWNEVSGNHDADRHTASLMHAKVQSSVWWPFLSQAAYIVDSTRAETDFDNRLSVVAERIEASVAPEVYEDVISSLRDDFRAVHEASNHSAQSTSPELAEFNTGLASHKADLDAEYFNASTNKWERVADLRPHSEQADDHYKPRHAEEDAPGYMGTVEKDKNNTPKEFGDSRKKATNYQPDPNAAWRYHYPNLNGPVDNGALQDGDGFPTDLAQGEDRSQPRLEWQATPQGEWQNVPGTAMPERPMPMDYSNQLGYHLVASHKTAITNPLFHTHKDHMEAGASGFDEQWEHAKALGDFHGYMGRPAQGDEPYADLAVEKPWSVGAMAYGHGYRNGDVRKEKELRLVDKFKHTGSYIDSDGFLVEASDVAEEGVRGRANSPLVDPPVGAPQRVNPFYFNTDEAAMGSNEGFPQQPSQDPMDRINEIYGEGGGPVASSGSEEGTIDGKGYSRSHPGESPDFNQKMSAREDHPGWGTAYFDMGRRHSNDGTPPKMRNLKDWQHDAYLDGYKSGYAGQHRAEAAHREYATPNGYEPHPDFEKAVENGSCLCNWYSNKKDEIHPSCPVHGHLMDPTSHEARLASTDGKIVGQCPGCSKPLRVHSTPHGDERRHLHNNHVRCFGAKTADMSPGSAVGADDDQDDSDPDDDDSNSMTAMGSTQFFDPTLQSTAADYMGRPDANNPTGRGPDEYRAERWDAFRTTRPMQSSEDRKINTPVLPQQHMPTPQINTPTPGLKEGPQEEDDDDDDDDE